MLSFQQFKFLAVILALRFENYTLCHFTDGGSWIKTIGSLINHENEAPSG